MGPFSEPLGYVPILEYYSKLQKWVSNSAPFLAPTFFTFLECTSLLLNTQKSAKQAIPKSQFLSCQRSYGSLKIDAAHAETTTADAIELTMNQTSDTLEAPPALGKNLNSWTQKRAYGRHRKFERQLAKPSRNLGRKPQERNPQWNRDNSKELWKPKEVCRKWREHVLWRLTDTEIVTKFALRIESLSWSNILQCESFEKAVFKTTNCPNARKLSIFGEYKNLTKTIEKKPKLFKGVISQWRTFFLGFSFVMSESCSCRKSSNFGV